jgi:hypothetical protein
MLSDLFEIKNGLASSEVKISEQKIADFNVPYIRPSSNYANLVAGYLKLDDIDKKYFFSADNIIVSTDGEGSHTYSYVSPVSFVPNSNVAVLIPKRVMSLREKIYYALCITKNRYRFSYGRKPKGQRLELINIPDEMPASFKKYKFVDVSKIKEPINFRKIALFSQRWGFFKCSDLFDFERGKRNSLNDIHVGTKTPIISAITGNNGLLRFSAENSDFDGQKITIGNTGQASVGVAFYQEDAFIGTNNITILSPKFKINSFIGLFFVSIFSKERYKFSFGRILNTERLKNFKIKLPVDKNGNPDWQFMEDYIKSLPYSSGI